MSDIDLSLLGIKNTPWSTWHIGVDEYVEDINSSMICNMMTDNWRDAQLIAAAPEMLKALIEEVFMNGGCNGQTIHLINIIQKATNKSWEEIKEVLGL